MVNVDPEVAARFDQNAAEYRSGQAAISEEFEAKQKEIAEQVDKSKAEFAAVIAEAKEKGDPDKLPVPIRRPEDDDLSAKAEAYQEPDEEPVPEPPAPPPVAHPVVASPPPISTPAPTPPVRQHTGDEEEVPSFAWDEDGPKPAAPPRPAPVRTPAAPTRAAKASEDEDMSEHDWFD